ncbi:GNAT family N-acetyltransferase [Yoonia sp.]|uniref:GNAT family N-acetyltransferase n=1 Tax=Yoonia sp. TaxID=2212373 RepID=UPI003F6B321C
MKRINVCFKGFEFCVTTKPRNESPVAGNDLTTRDPVIRHAQAKDALALASCIDAAYAQYAGRISDLPPVSDGCAEDIAINQVWVAALDDKVIAGLVLVADEGFMKLANLAVHPDHGGTGLGRKLAEFAEREAVRQGFNEMRLNTHVDMPENVRLYQHLGWAEVARSGSTVSMKKHLSDD